MNPLISTNPDIVAATLDIAALGTVLLPEAMLELSSHIIEGRLSCESALVAVDIAVTSSAISTIVDWFGMHHGIGLPGVRNLALSKGSHRRCTNGCIRLIKATAGDLDIGITPGTVCVVVNAHRVRINLRTG